MTPLIDNRRVQAGHETPAHRFGKSDLADSLRGFGCQQILFEHINSDVVTTRRVGSDLIIIANEYERSARNSVRNVCRNFEQGAHGVLVVGSDFRVMAAIARKLARALPPALAGRVGLTNLTALHLLQPQNEQESKES
jgi:hypothetical protein